MSTHDFGQQLVTAGCADHVLVVAASFHEKPGLAGSFCDASLDHFIEQLVQGTRK